MQIIWINNIQINNFNKYFDSVCGEFGSVLAEHPAKIQAFS